MLILCYSESSLNERSTYVTYDVAHHIPFPPTRGIEMTAATAPSLVRYRSFHFTGESLEEMSAALSFYFRDAEVVYWWIDSAGYLQLSATAPWLLASGQGTPQVAATAAMAWIDALDRLARYQLNQSIPNDSSTFTSLEGFSLQSSFRRWTHDPDSIKVCPAWV